MIFRERKDRRGGDSDSDGFRQKVFVGCRSSRRQKLRFTRPLALWKLVNSHMKRVFLFYLLDTAQQVYEGGFGFLDELDVLI